MKTTGKGCAKILIVEDHPLIRVGLSHRISTQSDMLVCGEADNQIEGYRLIRETNPDLVIADISLKCGNGIELIKQIAGPCPRVKTLVLSCYSETLYAERALRAGAMGYINKQEANDLVVTAIRTILNGGRFLSPGLTQILLHQAVAAQTTAAVDALQRLSNRELEIFQLIGRGMTSGVIAKQLHLSVHTIESHREKIRRKLRVKGRVQLMQEALNWAMGKR
ncbi:response regulator [Blastopirellula marina]|uniref:Two-component system response regulator-like protein (Nar family protein) n=1 Tax=Blastopirellula marina DSM 3645 TaxID=314230 RepID=A3ZTK6_9BACT|nr:response regulator transcription factor [Blastopirellula marina]EAQ80269.1 two-component system response regulator-like protein (Nar family protein) [Blastopirellula marina DSM 3645]